MLKAEYIRPLYFLPAHVDLDLQITLGTTYNNNKIIIQFHSLFISSHREE
jgi:hypothetical protein